MATSTTEDTIMEEKEERMVSPNLTKHHHPTRKFAPFLKPSATSIDLQPFSSNHSSIPKTCPLKVSFNGWRTQQKGWKDWVDRMHSLHKSTWMKAGIHDAVLNSSYDIKKNDSLILGFAEKWCHETKTFVFLWGEATITLEDMIILGGYSVLGESVVRSVENEESKTILKRLKEVMSELHRSTNRKADQFGWMKKFKDSGSEIEHEAFLILWLSRFVFPSSASVVKKSVFPIAFNLARGIKLALAPPVLASIYRDLSLLKAKFVDNSLDLKNNDHKDEKPVTVSAPLQLVQVWIWERYPKLRPNPELNCNPRFARWENKKLGTKNVDSLIDCAFQDYSWQPYRKNSKDLVFCNIYQEKGRWVDVRDCLDEEIESWVRCLRISELVGIDGNCIEQYLPHRVAMQFGINQDIPGDVARTNETPEIAWSFYSRPVKDVKLYFPSRFSEPGVTVRYFEWVNKPTRSSNNNENENFVNNESKTEGFKDSMGDDEFDTLGLKLEARICGLERVFEYLKAKKR